MKHKIKISISIIICLLPMIAGAVFYNQLPDQMPIHFGINNVPDNYAPKAFALFGIPLFLAIVQSLAMIMTYRSANKKNIRLPIIFYLLEWLIPVLTVLCYGLMLSFALGYLVSIGKIICLVLGAIFVIIGNYTPKMSYEAGKLLFHPNPATEEDFRKMSRLMGYGFIGCGLILILLGIFVV